MVTQASHDFIMQSWLLHNDSDAIMAM